MQGEKLVSLEHVALGYRRRAMAASSEPFWALKDISFDLHRGESLGVIGRNGVGKSSLLKLLAGILLPDKGQLVRHHDFRASLLTLQLGFSPQLSGRDNVILNGLLLGMSRREVEQQMEAVVEFSELQDFIDEPLNTYSSGMKARLGFAVAIRSRPDVLLIDEVMGVGDEDFKMRSTAVLREWIQSDHTVVFVSHSANSIRENCDRLVWVENGTVAMVGGVEEVLEKYEGFHHIINSLAGNEGIPIKQVRAMVKGNPLEFLESFRREYRQKMQEIKAQDNTGGDK